MDAKEPGAGLRRRALDLRLRLAYGKVWAMLHGVKDSVHELQKNTFKWFLASPKVLQ